MASLNEQTSRDFESADTNKDGVVSREEFEAWSDAQAPSNSKFAPPPPITEPAQLPGVTGKPSIDANTAYQNAKNECSGKSACGCQKEEITDKKMLHGSLDYILKHGTLDDVEKSARMRFNEKNYTGQHTKLRDSEAFGCDPKSIQSVIGSRFHPSTMALASRGDKIAVANIDSVWQQLQKRCDNKLKYSDLATAPPVVPINKLPTDKRETAPQIQAVVEKMEQRRQADWKRK